MPTPQRALDDDVSASDLRTATRLRRLTLAALAAAFVATHVPLPHRGSGGHWDKVAHVLIFAVLAGLAFLAQRAGRARESASFPLIFALAACYGAIDEITQPWFSRDADLLDWVADLCGAACGLAAAAAIDAWRRPRTIS